MTTGVGIAVASLAGLVVGGAYFAGLWWTARRVPTARNPALLLLASYGVRTAAAIGVLLVVAGHSWERWLAALLGFVVGRGLVRSRVVAGRPVTSRGRP